MVSSPPSRRVATKAGTAVIAAGASIAGYNGGGVGSNSGSGNHHVTTMQQRRRSSKSSVANGSIGIGRMQHPIALHGRQPRTPTRRKWFRGGGRKNNVLEIVMIFVSLCFWASVFRLEYNAIDDSSSSSSIMNYIYNDHSNKTTRKQPTYDSNDNDNDDSKIRGGKQSTRPHPRMNIPGKTRHQYDSIFCPVSTFRQQGESASRSNHSNIDPRGRVFTQQHPPRPVFLWGIPSTQSEFEKKRRDLLRKTYLHFYKQLLADETYQNSTNATLNNYSYDTICSFQDWTCNATVRADCQMIYLFFVGGHNKDDNSAPPFLLDESITNYRDMLLPIDQAKDFDLREPGTVYIDIRENQFDGKMTTWFKFASLVAKEYNSEIRAATVSVDHLRESKMITSSNTRNNIEYVFKVDSDLILFTPHFFNWFEKVHDNQQKLQRRNVGNKPQEEAQVKLTTPTFVRRVYGGVEFPATNCVENFTFDHPCPLPLSGPSYMSGELNFVSVDLAGYIASDNCPRERWTIPHEDVSLSNYVYSYINNTEYHKRENEQDGSDRSLHIVGIDTSNVLLLPNMRADWEAVNIRQNPDLLRTGELLWAHSIRRGNHSQYLYWKSDKRFERFWTRVFYKAFTTTGNSTFSRYRKKKGKEGRDILREKIAKRLREQGKNGIH